MPIVFEPKDLKIIKKNGAGVAVLADYSKLGTNALQVERIELQDAAKTPAYQAKDAERFVYVTRGKGQACVGDQNYSLSSESVLWLDKEDTFFLEASEEGLEVLLCQAPASD